MPTWHDGLVNALPIPEDRLPLKDRRRLRKTLEESSRLDTEALNSALTRLDLTSIPSTPFPFFSLPSELRNRIYHHLLFSRPTYRDHLGRRTSRLSPLLVSHLMHQESAYILYSTTRFNLFHLQKFETPPTILTLPETYLNMVKNVTMTVGESWTAPPKSWKVTPALKRCLKKMKELRTLRVFVAFDPSLPVFSMHRRSETFYTDFCGELLEDVLEVAGCEFVELDGNSGVDVMGPLVRRLKDEAEDAGKEVRWGREADWGHTHRYG